MILAGKNALSVEAFRFHPEPREVSEVQWNASHCTKVSAPATPNPKLLTPNPQP